MAEMGQKRQKDQLIGTAKSLPAPRDLIPEGQEVEKSVGFWNELEQQKYIIFIDSFKRYLNSRRKRRNNRVYRVMAEFIQTRTAVQCRNHHTKLIRTYRNIENIVKDFKQEIGNSHYFEAFKVLTSNYKLFDQHKKQDRKPSRPSPGPAPKTTVDVGVQTDYTTLLHCQHVDFEQPLEQNYKANFYLYYGPFVWLYEP